MRQEVMIYPIKGGADSPSEDMPQEVREDYEEADTIGSLSPRGAAALLRLALQKLCKHLGEPGKKIDDDIKSLVAKGLPPGVQQALDIVRVIGNEAVHPGTIDLRDDRETALKLFKLVNMVCEKMITEPKQLAELYGALPENKRQGIENRDAK